jgi:DNA-binding NarL/FixJ family response regulator
MSRDNPHERMSPVAAQHRLWRMGVELPWNIRLIERRVSPDRRLLERRNAERRAHALVTDEARNVRLTKREREIKELITAGLGNKEIAQRLHIATNTVKSHVHNMLGKLAALTPPERRRGSRSRRGPSRRSYRFTR